MNFVFGAWVLGRKKKKSKNPIHEHDGSISFPGMTLQQNLITLDLKSSEQLQSIAYQINKNMKKIAHPKSFSLVSQLGFIVEVSAFQKMISGSQKIVFQCLACSLLSKDVIAKISGLLAKASVFEVVRTVGNKWLQVQTLLCPDTIKTCLFPFSKEARAEINFHVQACSHKIP